MSGEETKQSLLRTLTQAELKEVARRFDVSLPGGLKQAQQAAHLARQLWLSDEEVRALVERYADDKLVGKVRDARDYFLTRQVVLEHVSDDLVQAKVAGYSVAISALVEGGASYHCDERCSDWLYQVRRGRYAYCKHYPAVIAELLFRGHVDATKAGQMASCPPALSEIVAMVDQRRREEGVTLPKGRDVEGTLAELKAGFLRIARQDENLARERYHDMAERQFEKMVDDCFQLLEFGTIPRRKEQGWDLLVLGTLAVPPYIVVVEAKTALSGVYDQILRNPDYLFRLKTYAQDMVRGKLFGPYREFVRYFLMVAPGFPAEVADLCSEFRRISDGITISFLPAPVLLDLVSRYRERPVLTHTALGRFFGAEKVLEASDVDAIFEMSSADLQQLVARATANLRSRMEAITKRTADAAFIELDLPSLGLIFRDVLRTLEYDLLVLGKTVTGTETVHIKHDYYALWKEALTALVDEFVDILRQESLVQEKQTAFKREILEALELKR